ncbi:MAG: hypothetical protein JXR96_11445 [Deltaproteobacteria bacterium]|nr:hypothetical protein [Deltaproteobacteria bacterium]
MLRVLQATCLAAIAAALLAPPCAAGPFRIMGHDTASMAQGGSQGAWGRGLGAIYSNPALLVDLDRGFVLDFFVVQPFLDTDLMTRPANADIPITFYDSDVGIEGENLDRPLPTAELRNPRADNTVDQPLTFLGIGIAHDLGIEDFMLGLALRVPTDGLAAVKACYPDEREQYFSNTVHFTRFGEWSQVLSLLFGLAYRPLDWLSVGASVEGALNIGATIDMFIPEASVQDYALVNTDFDAETTARAVVGFNFRPWDFLSISVIWRDRRYTRVEADAVLSLWNYHEAGDETQPKRVKQRHLLALDFEPMEVSLALGGKWRGAWADLTVSWNHWADYLDAHHERGQYTAVSDPAAQGESLSQFAFSDTFSVAFGMGYEYLDGFSAQVGFAYRPTPVPAQVGRTSYLDEDLFAATVGHRFDFTLWDQRLRAELALQFWKMIDATVHKDPALIKDEFPDEARTVIGGQLMPEAEGLQTNNPGFPGFSFGGWALHCAVTLAYLF